MTETFDEILDSLLESYESNPDKNVDELIAEKTEEFGISEESKKLLDETNESIVAFDDAYRELTETKEEEGISTSTWTRRELISIAKENGCTEEEQELLLKNVAETFEQLNDEFYENLEIIDEEPNEKGE